MGAARAAPESALALGGVLFGGDLGESPSPRQGGGEARAEPLPHPGRGYDAGSRPRNIAAALIGPAACGGRDRQSKEGRSFRMREDGSGSAPGAEVVATVKWFNPVKGFGFLTPADGSRDLFCHVSAVSRAGWDTLPEGATVTCEVERGPRGPQVWQIHSVDASTASTNSARGGGSRRRTWGRVPGSGVAGRLVAALSGKVGLISAPRLAG